MRHDKHFVDLMGMKFGKLTVIKRVENKNGHSATWECRCDCGTVFSVAGTALRAGQKHCKKCTPRWGNKIIHNMSRSRIYRIWHGIKDRCNNNNSDAYRNYGARGITFCIEWNEFLPFYDWAMQNGYTDELTIDRIDNNGNYEPSNCRFITILEQQKNKRTCIFIEKDGKRQIIADWAKETGLAQNVISNRLRYGWSMNRIFSPVRSRKRKSIATFGDAYLSNQLA